MNFENKQELTEPEANVLNYVLNHGSFEKPVPRKKLQHTFNMSKRKVEIIVETLLNLGHPIIGSKKFKQNGYFVAKDDYERYEATRPYVKQIETERRNHELRMSIDLEKYWNDKKVV